MTRGIDKGLRGCEALQIMYFVFSQVITEHFLLSIHNRDPSDNRVIYLQLRDLERAFVSAKIFELDLKPFLMVGDPFGSS